MAVLARWVDDKSAAGLTVVLACWRDFESASGLTAVPAHRRNVESAAADGIPHLSLAGATTSWWQGRGRCSLCSLAGLTKSRW